MTPDSDDEYDSEEERVRARVAYHSQERAHQQERARQAALLHEYKARQATKRALDDDLRRRRLGQEGHLHAEQRSATISGHPDELGAAVSLAALQQHQQRWEQLEQSTLPAASLTYSDIPWPPVDCPASYLRGLTRLEAHLAASSQHKAGPGAAPQAATTAAAAPRHGRRAYTRAVLRWHPDKFVHRLGKALAEQHSERILARVQAISQGLNRAWEETQQQEEQQL